MHFVDRIAAGKQLAEKLKSYRGKDLVVYAIPRGGVVVAAEIAAKLDAPLDLIVRKVGHPANPEYAVCAVTDNKQMLCDEKESKYLNPQILQRLIDKERAEAKRRREVYLKGRKQVSCRDKIAVLVDDGSATGLTIRAAIRELQSQQPKTVIVALPVVPRDVAKKLTDEDVQLVVLITPDDFLGSVGAYYASFPQVTDEEVMRLL